MQGLPQHLADPPLPRGTTLGGLAQPLGHLRPVPNGLSIHSTPAQDLEAFKADMISMLSDMLQASLSKFESQFKPSSGGQGDSAPAQTVASEPTVDVDVASNYDEAPQGPGDQSEGEIIDSEGDPADAGLPLLNLKMSEEEQRDFDEFSLASVSVPASKRPWKAQGDSDSKSWAQDVSDACQARPQAIAEAQSVKSAQCDHRSVQLRSVQEQPGSQAQFPVLVAQGQGDRLGRPVVVRRDDIDSLFNEDEFSIDLDNEAVLKENRLVQKFWTKLPNFVILTCRILKLRKKLWA